MTDKKKKEDGKLDPKLCPNCWTRLSLLDEGNGKLRLWCFNCGMAKIAYK